MKILKKLLKVGLVSVLALGAVLCFVAPVMAGDRIEKMSDLPSIKSSGSGVARYNSVGNQKKEVKTENDIIVLYKEDSDNNIGNLDLKKSDFAAGSSLNESVDVLRVKDENKVDEIIGEIDKNDTVLAVSRDGIAKILDIPNDKHFVKYQTYMNQIGYNDVWNTQSKNQVKVAVLDTGINVNHNDLKNRVEQSGVNYTDEEFTDTEGHGTGVASTVCAETNNTIGMAGTAGLSDVKAVDYKIADKNGESSISDMVTAIIDASKRDDINVINLSMGTDTDSDALEEAVKKADANGKVVVCASGNDNGTVMYPAAIDTAIATGAVNAENKRCEPSDWGEGNGSCYGKELKLVAPGNEIIGALNDDNESYTLHSGTSFSSPIVAGAAAVLLGQNKDLTPNQVKEILYSTAQDLGPAGRDDEYGYGIVRLDKALEKLKELPNDKINLSNSNLKVEVGETGQINAKSQSGKAINFKSADPSIATVSSSGLVKGISAGETTVTVSLASEPLISAVCYVSVVDKQIKYQEVSRLYNTVTGEHLYTKDRNEIASLTDGNSDWKNEGVKWESPNEGKPVYRLYSLITHNHLYTSDKNEVDTLLDSKAWTIDNNGKAIFYSGGERNIMRLYNSELKMHLLTTDLNEYNELQQHGWQQEGTKFTCH